MMAATLNVSFACVMCCISLAFCATINDTQILLKNLLADYDINVRPVANQSEAVNVTIQAYIKSIQEFDEVQGKLSFAGALLVSWNDVNMMWDPADYGGLWEMTVMYNNVWIPELVLLSPAEDVESMGKKWNKVRYTYDGTAQWLPADLIVSTCSVNVINYPFDKQECETSFSSFGYRGYEVKLYANTNKIEYTNYQENSLWDITVTKIKESDTAGDSQIDLILTLKRKPSFVIVNVILPILYLSLLNVAVFLLIPDSGERVSYAITVLLSIAVFMTIVSDMLPRSSEPVPFISYKLMVDMILSSLIVVVTVVNLKWYHTEDSVPVPVWLQSVYRTLTCFPRKPNYVSPAPGSKSRQSSIKLITIDGKEKTTNNEKPSQPENIEDQLGKLVKELSTRETVTWKMMSKLVDRIALIFFTSASIGCFIIFMAVTGASDV